MPGISKMQWAIINKDLKSVTGNKRMLSIMLIVPFVMTIVVPLIFIFAIHFSRADKNLSDLIQMLDKINAGLIIQQNDMKIAATKMIMNYIMPLFFLMIPIMVSSVMSASAFVGEKEKNTLETLLYCPLTLRDIFAAKILASFLLSMAVSFTSFIIMSIVVETVLIAVTGAMIAPGINWLIMMLLVSPSISLLAINLIVRSSAKSQSSEESQQRAVFLVLPVVLFIVGQFTGIMLLSVWLLLGIGVVLAVIALLLFRRSFGKFQYETLLI